MNAPRHPVIDAICAHAWQSDQACENVADWYARSEDVNLLTQYMCIHLGQYLPDSWYQAMDRVVENSVEAMPRSGLEVDRDSGDWPLYMNVFAPWWVLLRFSPSYPYEPSDTYYREDEDEGWEYALEELEGRYAEFGLIPKDGELRVQFDDHHAVAAGGVPQDLHYQVVRPLNDQGPWCLSRESFERMADAVAAAWGEAAGELEGAGVEDSIETLNVNRTEIRARGIENGADDPDEDEPGGISRESVEEAITDRGFTLVSRQAPEVPGQFIRNEFFVVNTGLGIAQIGIDPSDGEWVYHLSSGEESWAIDTLAELDEAADDMHSEYGQYLEENG